MVTATHRSFNRLLLEGSRRTVVVAAFVAALLLLLTPPQVATDSELAQAAKQQVPAPEAVDEQQPTVPVTVELLAMPAPQEAAKQQVPAPEAVDEQQPTVPVTDAPVAGSAPQRQPQLPSRSGRLKAGSFPEISVGYQDLGFASYAEAMGRLGARFFVARAQHLELLAEVRGGQFDADIEVQRLRGLSPRSRDITDEPQVAHWLEKAGEAFGPDRFVFIVLIPQTVESAIQDSLRKFCERAGIPLDRVVRFSATYGITGDKRLALHVHELTFHTGRNSTNWRIVLG